MTGHSILSSSLSPNVAFDDVQVTYRTICAPRRWITGSAPLAVEKWFENYFENVRATTFNSGRSALYAVLLAFGIGGGDEVIVQAFTCVAVPNAVIWTGATPIYADIDESLNISVTDIEKKITKKTKAIIVQHTLGTPANLNAIAPLARKYNLFIIEDCAHSLGALYNGKKVGSIGDAAIFSFGRDKIVSSVFGGLAIIAKKHAKTSQKLKELHQKMSDAPRFWVFQQLLHPIAFSFILPLYRLQIGKLLLWLLQRSRLLSYPVYPEEKKGGRPVIFPAKYPNALAELLLNQLNKLSQYNATRVSRGLLYRQLLSGHKGIEMLKPKNGEVFLRFPVLVSNPSEVILQAKKKGILLGNWYHNVVDPEGVDFEAIGYAQGSCPVAEKAALCALNLPTNITALEVQRVVKALRYVKEA